MITFSCNIQVPWFCAIVAVWTCWSFISTVFVCVFWCFTSTLSGAGWKYECVNPCGPGLNPNGNSCRDSLQFCKPNAMCHVWQNSNWWCSSNKPSSCDLVSACTCCSLISRVSVSTFWSLTSTFSWITAVNTCIWWISWWSYQVLKCRISYSSLLASHYLHPFIP